MLADDLAAALDPVTFARGFGFAAEPWQAALMRSAAARALVLCARQVGKSTTVGYRALHRAVFKPGALVLIVSPTQRQSDEQLGRVTTLYRGMGEQPRPSKSNSAELALANGSRIVSLPGSEGGIRGFAGVDLLILDEAARVDDDVFASCLPMVASAGQIVALSTPWGRRGWFFERHDDVTSGWERHKVTCYESEQYSPARIGEVRDALGSFVFASDYECVFGDTETQLFGTEAVRAAFSRAVAPLEFA